MQVNFKKIEIYFTLIDKYIDYINILYGGYI